MAKAVYWYRSDGQARKLGEQNGLDTRVVLAVNDLHQVLAHFRCASAVEKSMSGAPGDYGRKAET